MAHQKLKPLGQNEDPVKISDAAWYEVKEIIRQKYISENCTLHQIRAFMSDSHGFRASLNQYQRVLKKWNFRKNSKRKDYEQAIVFAKRRKLDLDDVQITGVHANIQQRLKRGLSRYDAPGLEYTREFLSTESHNRISNKSPESPQSLKTQIRPTAKFQQGRLKLLSSSTLDYRYIKDLPVLQLLNETTSLGKEVLHHSFGNDYDDEHSTKTLSLLLRPIQTVNEDVEVILGADTFEPSQTVLTSVVYDIANNRHDGFELRHILRWIVEQRVERLLEPILKAELHAAKACSENILKALFQLELTRTPTKTFCRLFDLLLPLGTDVDLTVCREVWEYGVPIKVTLLQLTLLLGNLSLASRLFHAGARFNYCAEHGSFAADAGRSCCELLPIILLTERVALSMEKETSLQYMWTKLSSSGVVYCKDITMVRLTAQPFLLRLLLSQNIHPDAISRTLPRTLFKNRDRPLSYYTDKEIYWLTALQSAIDQGDLSTVETLLDAGANPSGHSIWTLAEFFKSLTTTTFVSWQEKTISKPVELSCLLLQHSCTTTPLSIASYKGDIRMIRLLLQRRATIDGCQFDAGSDTSCHKSDLGLSAACTRGSLSQSILRNSIHDVLEVLNPSQDITAPSSKRKLFRKVLPTDPEIAQSGHDPILGCSPLQMAVLFSQIETVLCLLNAGADIECCHGLTPLALAVRNSNYNIMGVLLERGANPAGLTSHGPNVTPLAVAAYLNNVPALKVLVEASELPLFAPTRAMEYSLWQAALEGNSLDSWEFLSEAVENGVLVGSLNDKTELITAAIGVVDDEFIQQLVGRWKGEICPAELQILLRKSAQQNRSSLVRYFLQQGATVNDPNFLREAISILPPPGQEAEYWADEYLADESWEDKSSLIEVLIEEQFALRSDNVLLTFDAEELTKFFQSRGKPRFTVRTLLTHWMKTHPFLEDREVYKLMETFLAHRQRMHEDPCEMMLLLLERGLYNDNRTCHCLSTPLQFAAEWGKLSLAQELIRLGADVNASAAQHGCKHDESFETSRGAGAMTALNHAVMTNDLQMASILLAAGADVHIPHQRRFHGRTSWITTLQLAVSTPECSVELLQLLINHGSDVNSLVNYDAGMTALQFAAVYGDEEIMNFLLDQGADINGPIAPWYGMSALQQAAYWGRSELVTLFLDRGADINAAAARHGGLTALQAASLKGHLSVCLQLIAAGADLDAVPSEKQGGSAIECAASSGRLDILKLLLDLWVERHLTDDDERLENVVERAKQQAMNADHNYIVKFLDDYKQDRRREVEESNSKDTLASTNLFEIS